MTIRKKSDKVLKGIVVSTGIAIGKVYVLNRFHLCIIRHELKPDKVKKEIDRFHTAVETTKNKMMETARESAKNLADEVNYILHPQIQLLNDPIVIDSTTRMVEKELVNSEWALKQTFDKLAAGFRNIKDPFFQGRLHDFELVINMVMQVLTGTESETFQNVKEPVIVVSHDLSPFDTAQMASSKILGFVTEVGGKTSHTGIIASSLQIPALVGVKGITNLVQTGDTMIIDAIGGHVFIHPSQESFLRYNQKRLEYIHLGKKLESEVGFATETKDGVRVSLKANIESSHDISNAIEHGAEGIGLFRTEFLFLDGRVFPDEEGQFKEYKKVAEAVAPNEAIIRTLDLGGEKIPWSYQDEPEPNPALGLRAIRYCLDNRALFNSQLRAILRASPFGKIKIMYPMVSNIEELRKANGILEKQKRELAREGIPFNEKIEVGMMVEVPSAALVLHQFVPYVSFFSIGTNDLIQYLLAIDRANAKVAYLYEPLHPAVLRLLYMIIQTANMHNVPVSICGKMSSDPIYAYLLLGMGRIADLSMEWQAIPKIKKFIRNIFVSEARKDVEKILNLGRIKDIKKYLTKKVSPLLEEGLISEVLIEDYEKEILLR